MIGNVSQIYTGCVVRNTHIEVLVQSVVGVWTRWGCRRRKDVFLTTNDDDIRRMTAT